MRDDCERINEQRPPLADAFREIHRFILKAVDGNAATANALFQRYLNGELPDELLRISRSWVQEEQACTPSSSEGESIGSLILKRANTSRLSGQWSDDDYDALKNGVDYRAALMVPIAPAERP
jgi:hypothetical protein